MLGNTTQSCHKSLSPLSQLKPDQIPWVWAVATNLAGHLPTIIYSGLWLAILHFWPSELRQPIKSHQPVTQA